MLTPSYLLAGPSNARKPGGQGPGWGEMRLAYSRACQSFLCGPRAAHRGSFDHRRRECWLPAARRPCEVGLLLSAFPPPPPIQHLPQWGAGGGASSAEMASGGSQGKGEKPPQGSWAGPGPRGAGTGAPGGWTVWQSRLPPEPSECPALGAATVRRVETLLPRGLRGPRPPPAAWLVEASRPFSFTTRGGQGEEGFGSPFGSRGRGGRRGNGAGGAPQRPGPSAAVLGRQRAEEEMHPGGSARETVTKCSASPEDTEGGRQGGGEAVGTRGSRRAAAAAWPTPTPAPCPWAGSLLAALPCLSPQCPPEAPGSATTLADGRGSGGGLTEARDGVSGLQTGCTGLHSTITRKANESPAPVCQALRCPTHWVCSCAV